MRICFKVLDPLPEKVLCLFHMKVILIVKTLWFQRNKVVRYLSSFSSSVAMAVMAKEDQGDKICPEREIFSNYN